MIAVRDLTVNIGKRTIIDRLSFDLMPGWNGLLGVNGSGKTTLLRALSARLPVASGRIECDGVDITGDEATRARMFGYSVPVDGLPARLRGGELLEALSDLHNGAEPPSSLRDALLTRQLTSSLVGGMSAGMKQRLSLLCAFVGEPRVVLLDEPFNWLDPVAAHQLKAALKAEAARGVCLLTALHDVGTFARYCDAGLMIHDGRLSRVLTTEDMPADPSSRESLEDDLYRSFSAQTDPEIER